MKPDQCQHLHLRQRPRHRVRDLRVGLMGLMLVALAGCAGSSAKPQADGQRSSQSSSASDPCAQRLHDLVGGLLLYYAQHQQLPANLKSLELPSGKIQDDLVCPVSHQPYIYDPHGIPGPEGKSRLIIYDAVPVHGAFRWAVAIAEPKAGQPLVAEVVLAPESLFAVAPFDHSGGTPKPR